ncbi:hypothetical protein GQ457_03G016910 [Hibiscus cannabinus]
MMALPPGPGQCGSGELKLSKPSHLSRRRASPIRPFRRAKGTARLVFSSPTITTSEVARKDPKQNPNRCELSALAPPPSVAGLAHRHHQRVCLDPLSLLHGLVSQELNPNISKTPMAVEFPRHRSRYSTVGWSPFRVTDLGFPFVSCLLGLGAGLGSLNGRGFVAVEGVMMEARQWCQGRKELTVKLKSVHDGDKDEAGRWYVRGAAMVCWKMGPWGRNVHLRGAASGFGFRELKLSKPSRLSRRRASPNRPFRRAKGTTRLVFSSPTITTPEVARKDPKRNPNRCELSALALPPSIAGSAHRHHQRVCLDPLSLLHGLVSQERNPNISKTLMAVEFPVTDLGFPFVSCLLGLGAGLGSLNGRGFVAVEGVMMEARQWCQGRKELTVKVKSGRFGEGAKVEQRVEQRVEQWVMEVVVGGGGGWLGELEMVSMMVIRMKLADGTLEGQLWCAGR